MVTQRNYNLRPRTLQNSAARKYFPKPQIGDEVSIFWETLNKKYNGRLTRFDDGEKTFLVNYDEIPEGYDCSSIWENLDYVPWRFLSRSEQQERQRTGMCVRRSLRIRKGEYFGPVDDARPLEWYDPGDLSTAYPEFDSKSSESWGKRKKKKNTRNPCDDHQEDLEENNTWSSLWKPALPNGVQGASGNQRERGETEVVKEKQLFQEASRGATSSKEERNVSNIERPKKRKYANFRIHEFKSVRQHVPLDIGHTTYQVNSVPCYALKTEKENCSKNIGMAPEYRRVELNDSKFNCFTVRTGNHLPEKFTPSGSGSDSPSVEEQIRSITRSMGLSD